MHKIWIVLRSEYLRRVRTKGFILTTLLLPLAITAFLGVIVLLTVSALQEEEVRTIAVVDETGVLLPRLAGTAGETVSFVAADVPVDSLRALVIAEERYAGYLVLPRAIVDGDAQAVYYSSEGGGTFLEGQLNSRVEHAVESERLARQNVSQEVMELVNRDVPLRMVKLTEEGEEAGSTGFFIVLGFIMGFLIFMMMVAYGSVVMQGVIDEKSSRVVEVVISSVRPFELMMGKVLGIGAMGLTQMVAWTALTMAMTVAAGPLIAIFLDPASMNLPATADTEEILKAANITIPSIDPSIFVWFILYFLLGYLLFASLYATIGSLVENQQEAQSFLLPVLLPVIVAMYTLMPQVENPNSTLALAMSMIPLTSPISMVVRMAVTDVPVWQLLLSLLLLAATFVGFIWIGARIYRIGILMYGKKPSLKDLAKWLRYA